MLFDTDVLIAATDMENQIVLVTDNVKNFKAINELLIKEFRPE